MKLILGSIAIFLWGLFMLLRPSTCWNLFESWKNTGNTGPSKFYLIEIRIGGGICNEGDALLVPLQEKIWAELSDIAPEDRTKIVIAQLGNDAGIFGAALLNE